MTIAFPRELPEGVSFRATRFEPLRAIAASRSKNRVSNRSQIADPAWVVDLETMRVRYRERMLVEAWAQSLRGGLRMALYRHVESCFPAAHPGDGGVAVDPGNLVSVANGNELTVDSVNAGLVLAPGDLVGLEEDDLRALGMVTDVSGTGTQRVITIEPEPSADVAVAGAVVRFVRPGLLMRLVPGSLKTTESGTGFFIVRFSLEESR